MKAQKEEQANRKRSRKKLAVASKWEPSRKGGEKMNRTGDSLSKKCLALLLAACLIAPALTGCQRLAEEAPGASEEETAPEAPQAQQPQDENGAGLAEENKTSGEVELEADDKLSAAAPSDAAPDSSEEESAEGPEAEAELTGEQPAQEVDTTPQTQQPASQTGAQGLDTTKLGWGPGGPVDENNRPDGATVYQEKYGQYAADFIRENNQNIYLTFDEGYENGYTDDILDTLQEKGVQAVFFVTMPYVQSEPELVQRMIDEGHIVGNHSVNHPSFPEISFEECQQEIMELHDYVKENFGYEMSLFRFPMGEFSEADLKVVQDLGYRSVFWSFAYRDWLVDEQPDPQEAIATIEDKCHPGAIYLLHAVSETNAQILGQVIDDLRGEGYVFCAYQ